eukprot:7146963-Prorocentrum_lima.AAC.1
MDVEVAADVFDFAAALPHLHHTLHPPSPTTRPAVLLQQSSKHDKKSFNDPPRSSTTCSGTLRSSAA